MDSGPLRRYTPRIASLDKRVIRKRAPAASIGVRGRSLGEGLHYSTPSFMWWPPCWTEVRHLFSTVSVAKLRAYERDSFSGACNAKPAYLSFRELSLPETGFPRMSLLGSSLNRGNSPLTLEGV